MSRSRKKTPIVGAPVASIDKQQRQSVHRALRQRVRQRLRTDPEVETLPRLREIGAIEREKLLVDPAAQPEALRK